MKKEKVGNAISDTEHKNGSGKKEKISHENCVRNRNKFRFQKVVYDFDIDIYDADNGCTECHTLTACFTIDTPLPSIETLHAANSAGITNLTYVVDAIWDGTTSYSGTAFNELQWTGSAPSELGYAFASIDIPGLIRLKVDDIESAFDRSRVENWRVGDHQFTIPDGDAYVISKRVSAVSTTA